MMEARVTTNDALRQASTTKRVAPRAPTRVARFAKSNHTASISEEDEEDQQAQETDVLELNNTRPLLP